MKENQKLNSSSADSDHVTLNIDDVYQVLNVTLQTDQEDQNE